MDDSYRSSDHTSKRIRLSSPSGSARNVKPVQVIAQSEGTTGAQQAIDAQSQKEAKVGIEDFVSDGLAGFSGIFKKR